ncbi:MAG: endonuclease/exonuclease/phosphatase family protein [Marivibrio sp.]|uniref:endonuclease/exonuclease/phosphatase family protein n=1 Tax=Marivibrio sp. TaxID=2039719 RepID=UPI0032EB03A5
MFRCNLKSAVFALSLFMLAPTPAAAETLTLASWNLEWLGAPQSGPACDADATEETRCKDMAALQRTMRAVNADVIAFQEVKSPAAAAAVFGEDYVLYFSDRAHRNPQRTDDSEQRTGFAVAKRLVEAGRVMDLPDRILRRSTYTRLGAETAIRLSDGRWLHLLSVHLKSGCSGGLFIGTSDACEDLRAETLTLADWIDEREMAGVPYMALGDFNRRFDEEAAGRPPEERMMTALEDGYHADTRLTLIPSGRQAICWPEDKTYFLDYMMFGEALRPLVEAGSFIEHRYPVDSARRHQASDHCPISVRLTVPAG